MRIPILYDGGHIDDETFEIALRDPIKRISHNTMVPALNECWPNHFYKLKKISYTKIPALGISQFI